MQRIQKILEVASHPNTPPVEALAALTLFRDLIDKAGGIDMLFGQTSVVRPREASGDGFNLFGRRGAPRRYQAEIAALYRQIELSRTEADNLRSYAQRGFAAEQEILTLRAALAAARNDVAHQPDPKTRIGQAAHAAGSGELEALRMRLMRTEALLSEASRFAHERDVAEEKVIQLTQAGIDYFRRVEAAEAQLAESRLEKTGLQLRLTDRESKLSDLANDVQLDRDASTTATAARRQAEDRLADAKQQIERLNGLNEQTQRRLQSAIDASSQKTAELKTVDHVRVGALEEVSQISQERDDQHHRLIESEQSLTSIRITLAQVTRERDDALRTLMRHAEPVADRAQPVAGSAASVALDRNKDAWAEQVDTAEGIASLRAALDDSLDRVQRLEAALSASEKARRSFERQAGDLRRDLAALAAAKQTLMDQHAKLQQQLATIELEARRTEQERDVAIQRVGELFNTAQRHLLELDQARETLAGTDEQLRSAEKKYDETLACLSQARHEMEAVTDARNAEGGRIRELESKAAQNAQELELSLRRYAEATDKIGDLEAGEANHIKCISDLVSHLAALEKAHAVAIESWQQEAAVREARWLAERKEIITYSDMLRVEQKTTETQLHEVQARVERQALTVSLAKSERDYAVRQRDAVLSALNESQRSQAGGDAHTADAADRDAVFPPVGWFASARSPKPSVPSSDPVALSDDEKGSNRDHRTRPLPLG